MAMAVHPFLLLTIASTSNAYSIFNTTCTTPNQTANFVRSPDARGTLDILWSCLFTIFACTWTVQHLNIPEQRNGRDVGWRGDMKWKLKAFWRNLKWMLATMIAPELLLAKFWQDLATARLDLPHMKQLARMDKVEWTLSHSLFADMGGFMIVGNTGNQPETLQKTDIRLAHIAASSHPPPSQEEIEPMLEQVPHQGATVRAYSYRRPHHDPFHLTAAGICNLRRSGLLPKLPCVTSEEIADKSKSDAFARTISILQIGWIVAQVIVRKSKSLSISQLEIAVVAFSVCSICIYALAWFKPKDVSMPYTLMSFPNDIPEEVINATLVNQEEAVDVSMLYDLFGCINRSDRRIMGAAIRNDRPATGLANKDGVQLFMGIAIGSAIFGGIHLAAWNFIFPTRIESILWKVTSVYSTAFILVFTVVGAAESWFTTLLTRVVTSLYVLARLFILIEIFRTLLFLPPDAYRAS